MNAPRRAVTAIRSSAVSLIRQPISAPTAASSSIASAIKARITGSSSSLSAVERVNADSGLIVALWSTGVPPYADLWDATLEVARTISGNAPLAIKAAKITIAQVLKDPATRDFDAIKNIGAACMDSEDFREGRRAFMEKRKPVFKGK